MIGSAQIPTPSIITPVADAIIQQSVTLYQTFFGEDLTAQCRDLLVFTQCINILSPCADRVWCSDRSVDELQQKVNESCRCTGDTFNTRLCEASIGGLYEQISNLTNYYETDQAPSNSTCEIVTLRESYNAQCMSTHQVTYVCTYAQVYSACPLIKSHTYVNMHRCTVHVHSSSHIRTYVHIHRCTVHVHSSSHIRTVCTYAQMYNPFSSNLCNLHI